MLDRALWLHALTGGIAAVLIFELCDLAFPQQPWIRRLLGGGLFFLVVMALTVVYARTHRKKQ